MSTEIEAAQPLKRKRPQQAREDPPAGRKRRRADEAEDREEPPILLDAAEDEETLATAADASDATALIPARGPKEKKQQKDKAAKYKGWKLSAPVGGRYIDNDAHFTSDGQYLLAAKPNGLSVLSLEDSIPLRVFGGPDGARVLAFAASKVEPTVAYIAYAHPSQIVKVDWNSESNVEAVPVEGEIRRVIVGKLASGTSERVCVLSKSGEQSRVTADGKLIFETPADLQDIVLSRDVVLAFGRGGKLVIGSITDNDDPAVVREWDLNVQVVAAAFRARTNTQTKKKTQSEPQHTSSVAVGTSTGEIFIYDGVTLSKQVQTSLPTPRTLHWHRGAVGSLKWSRDGNYLISGGMETTLVIWQLSTGKRQYLPHLSADIEHITVSPTGSSYALQLADNSIMVLSTAELKPTAHFPGIQPSLCSTKALLDIQNSDKQSAVDPSLLRISGCLHPQKDDELVFAVPTTNPALPNDNRIPSRPFVQSFNVSAGRPNYKQAVTRNKVTDLGTGPEGNVICDPDVTHLTLGHDGTVMVSVEHWSPLQQNFEFLSDESADVQRHADSRQEIHLKFWRWNETKSCWALQTRVTNPHQSSEGARPTRVLSLISDALASRFFTLGADHMIRIWTAKRTLANQPQEWTSRTSHHLPSTDPALFTHPTTFSLRASHLSGALALSSDSSLLAVSLAQSARTTSDIQLLRADTLLPVANLPRIPGNLHAMAFSARRLVVLTTAALCTLDVPSLTLVSTAPLPHPKPSVPLASRPRHLALARDGGLALATYPSPHRTAVTTRVEVLDVSKRHPVTRFRADVPGVVGGVFALSTAAGWRIVTLDGGEVYTLVAARDVGAVVERAEAKGRDEVEVEDGAVAVAAAGVEDAQGDDGMDVDAQGDRRVVRPEQLAALFETSAQQAQGVRAMFHGVVGLFGRRAVARV